MSLSPETSSTRGADPGAEPSAVTAVRVAPRLPSGWQLTVLLVVVAVVARVAYWKLAIPRYDPISDASQYVELARNVAHGHGLSMVYPGLVSHPSAFRPPVYPLLLGSWWWIFGATVAAGQALSVITGVATVLLTERLGRRLAGPLAGLVAALAVAVFVPLVADDVMLLTESLSMLLLVGTLILLVDRRPVLAGLTAGLLVLTRPSAQGLAIVMAVWLAWTVGWRRALYFLGVVVLLVVPWIIRNDIQLGSPVMYTSDGYNLAAMYSVQAQATGHFVDPAFDKRFDDLRLLQQHEAAWSGTLSHRGQQGLESNPAYVLQLVGLNSLSWFELNPLEGDSAERLDGRNISVDHWSLPEFYLFTLGGIAGLAVTWRRRSSILLGAVWVYFTATSLVLIAAPRLRAPVDLISCIGLGLLASWWWERRHQKAGSSSAHSMVVTSRL